MGQMQDKIMAELRRIAEAAELELVVQPQYAGTGTAYAQSGFETVAEVRYAFHDTSCRIGDAFAALPLPAGAPRAGRTDLVLATATARRSARYSPSPRPRSPQRAATTTLPRRPGHEAPRAAGHRQPGQPRRRSRLRDPFTAPVTPRGPGSCQHLRGSRRQARHGYRLPAGS
jgi:hypothetical protein